MPSRPTSRLWPKTRTPAELFWAIRSGIKFTGMPSFGLAGAKDDQIWSIVAFIKNLPSMSDADYKDWTAARWFAAGRSLFISSLVAFEPQTAIPLAAPAALLRTDQSN